VFPVEPVIRKSRSSFIAVSFSFVNRDTESPGASVWLPYVTHSRLTDRLNWLARDAALTATSARKSHCNTAA
jgi:hypothetical protein